MSVLGGSLIAISQSFGGENSSERGKVSPRDNLTGCSLQLLAVVFSALSRILAKKTEDILTPTHIVQTNNVSNCLIPFAITMIRNPSSWYAFRYLPFAAPKSLVAWCTISIGVYSFASILQVRLVRKLGPGLYSSWASFRTLGTMVLSASILGEGISGLLEWLGVGLLVASMSVYLGETRKWLDRNSGEKLGDDYAWDKGTEDDGDDELVPIGREKRPLLAGDAG
jgi:drug/metabolite transporter (DMT)-like permease